MLVLIRRLNATVLTVERGVGVEVVGVSRTPGLTVDTGCRTERHRVVGRRRRRCRRKVNGRGGGERPGRGEGEVGCER